MLYNLDNNRTDLQNYQRQQDKNGLFIYPAWISIIALVVSSLVTAITIIGNGMVLLAFHLERALRHASNYLVVSLATCNLLMGIVSTPTFALQAVTGLWPLGWTVCQIWYVVDWALTVITMQTAFFIAVDRYKNIKSPNKYPVWRTEKKVLILILFTWASDFGGFCLAYRFATRDASPDFTVAKPFCDLRLGLEASATIQIFVFWIPFITMCFMYHYIFATAAAINKRHMVRERLISAAINYFSSPRRATDTRIMAQNYDQNIFSCSETVGVKRSNIVLKRHKDKGQNTTPKGHKDKGPKTVLWKHKDKGSRTALRKLTDKGPNTEFAADRFDLSDNNPHTHTNNNSNTSGSAFESRSSRRSFSNSTTRTIDQQYSKAFYPPRSSSVDPKPKPSDTLTKESQQHSLKKYGESEHFKAATGGSNIFVSRSKSKQRAKFAKTSLRHLAKQPSREKHYSKPGVTISRWSEIDAAPKQHETLAVTELFYLNKSQHNAGPSSEPRTSPLSGKNQQKVSKTRQLVKFGVTNRETPVVSSIAQYRTRRALRMISSILLLFLICYFPFYFLHALRSTSWVRIPGVVIDFFYWFLYVNSAINPFIYAYTNPQFTKTLRRIAQWDFSKNRLARKTMRL